MRIIAGKYKNRVIPTLKNSGYRPSTAKFREALFSILSSGEFAKSQILLGANILDVYSGSGAISFEAISRGAGSACLIDNNADNLRIAREFAEKIGANDNMNFLQIDALFLPKSTRTFEIVFIDPPYYRNMAVKTIKSLISNGWLANGAVAAIELAKNEHMDEIDGLELLKNNIYGNSRLLLFKYNF